MIITRKSVEARLVQLRAEQEQVKANLVQLQANLNAYDGAIQEASFWLAQLDAEATQASVPAPEL
jgi:hypothetical protein